MRNNPIDASPRNVLRIAGIPDVATVKTARRWLRGAARLLADASNGDLVIDKLACEASTLAVVAEIVIHEHDQER